MYGICLYSFGYHCTIYFLLTEWLSYSSVCFATLFPLLLIRLAPWFTPHNKHWSWTDGVSIRHSFRSLHILIQYPYILFAHSPDFDDVSCIIFMLTWNKVIMNMNRIVWYGRSCAFMTFCLITMIVLKVHQRHLLPISSGYPIELIIFHISLATIFLENNISFQYDTENALLHPMNL